MADRGPAGNQFGSWEPPGFLKPRVLKWPLQLGPGPPPPYLAFPGAYMVSALGTAHIDGILVGIFLRRLLVAFGCLVDAGLLVALRFLESFRQSLKSLVTFRL